MSDANQTMTVYVVMPARPEHFAYGPYPTFEAACKDTEFRRYERGRPVESNAVIKKVENVPTWTYATKNDFWAFVKQVGHLRHDDGTPWTEEDWNRPHPDTAFINKAIFPRRVSGI